MGVLKYDNQIPLHDRWTGSEDGRSASGQRLKTTAYQARRTSSVYVRVGGPKQMTPETT